MHISPDGAIQSLAEVKATTEEKKIDRKGNARRMGARMKSERRKSARMKGKEIEANRE